MLNAHVFRADRSPQFLDLEVLQCSFLLEGCDLRIFLLVEKLNMKSSSSSLSAQSVFLGTDVAVAPLAIPVPRLVEAAHFVVSDPPLKTTGSVISGITIVGLRGVESAGAGGVDLVTSRLFCAQNVEAVVAPLIVGVSDVCKPREAYV
jgi:hypothetical protein